MKSHILAALLLGGAMSLAAVSANAATFDWTLTGPAASLGGFAEDGSGTLTTGLVGGKLAITGITGQIGGSAITGLITSTIGGVTPDNLFFADTLLDTHGLGVQTASGQSIDIFSFFAPGSKITPGNNFGELGAGAFGVGTFSATAVPEPSVWALFIAGFFGIGALLRRRTGRFARPLGQTA